LCYREKVVGVFVRFRAPLHPRPLWNRSAAIKFKRAFDGSSIPKRSFRRHCLLIHGGRYDPTHVGAITIVTPSRATRTHNQELVMRIRVGRTWGCVNFLFAMHIRAQDAIRHKETVWASLFHQDGFRHRGIPFITTFHCNKTWIPLRVAGGVGMQRAARRSWRLGSRTCAWR
jgi:hypothetical protein